MKRSCSYCGRIHERSFVCPSKPKTYKKPTHIDKFRWSKAWRTMRELIKQRDLYLCQVCKHEHDEFNSDQLEVHHIVPIAKSWQKRLSENNLITLCRTCHERAEKNEIKASVLRGYIQPETPQK